MNNIAILRICVFGNLLVLFIVVLTIFKFQTESSYFRIGPSDDFLLISVVIDTWRKYIGLLVMITVVTVIKVFVQERGMPLLGFNIYNPDKKIITDFTKNELQFYGNFMFAISAIREVFEVMVRVTQIDIALFAVLIAELTTIVTIRQILNKKKFVKKVKKKYNYCDLRSDNDEELDRLV